MGQAMHTMKQYPELNRATDLGDAPYAPHDSRHIPVLLREVLEAVDPKPGNFIIDGTFGGGGYARAILRRMGGSGRFLGVDWSADAVGLAPGIFAPFEGEGISLSVAHLNFVAIPDFLEGQSLGLADALVLDLGFSSDEIEISGRGFSFRHDEPLLMTYSDEYAPVRDILRELSESELREVIRDLSGERFAGRIAKEVKSAGRRKAIETTAELAGIVRSAVPSGYERGRIDPATRTFMALRIYANRELENLSELLGNLRRVVRPGGRVAVVSFHSLEDRIVKQEFQNLKAAGTVTVLTKKPIVPSPEEVAANPRARSAKLRVAMLQ
jgi:16S rRNA (cytosine1402-N4)-methyltransferase